MNVTFFESHLRSLYMLFGHSGNYTRVGSLDYQTKKYEDRVFQSIGDIIDYAKSYNGVRNIFMGRASRDAKGNLISVRCITFDIDPIRIPKERAALDYEHYNALNAGKRILARYPGGYLCSSGNGCLLIYYVHGGIVDMESHYAKEAIIIKELQELVGDLNVKIDHTNYASAVVKAIGTFSTKGDMQLRRCSRFMENPVPPYRNCQKLLQRLSEIDVSQSVATQTIDVRGMLSNYKGDRSQADFHLVNYLHRSGVGPEAALAALQANPLGRQTDEKDQARLIGKIYGQELQSSDTKGTYFTRLFEEKKDSDNPIHTGFTEFDSTLQVFPKGELTTFAARTGFGKSTFACTVAESLRQLRKKVLYFSTEMHKDYIIHKLLAISKNIPLEALARHKQLENYEKQIRAYEQELLLSPIVVCDEFQPTVEFVEIEIIKNNPDLVILDHFSHIETHWEKQTQYLNKLKEIAIKQEVPIMILNELGEPPRGKDGTEMQSLRGDVRGTQHLIYVSANFVYMTNPFIVKGDYQPVEFHIAKNRYGSAAGKVVTLTCDKVISKFIERKENGSDLQPL